MPTPAKKPQAPTVPVCIYARKSSDEKEDGQSLSVAAQLDDCRAYCKRHGYEVVAELSDDGISGRYWPGGKEWDASANADIETVNYGPVK